MPLGKRLVYDPFKLKTVSIQKLDSLAQMLNYCCHPLLKVDFHLEPPIPMLRRVIDFFWFLLASCFSSPPGSKLGEGGQVRALPLGWFPGSMGVD